MRKFKHNVVKNEENECKEGINSDKGVQIIKKVLNWASDRLRRVLGLGEPSRRPVRVDGRVGFMGGSD
jgi:hypothetical protein